MLQTIPISVGWSTLCVFLLVLLLYYTYVYLSRRSGLPPGPIGWPVIGNLFQLMRDKAGVHVALVKLAENYGDVFSLYFGSKLVIILNGYDAIREAFVNRADVLNNRPSLLVLEMLSNGKGIVGANGHDWKAQRTFFLKTLRRIDVGQSRKLEHHILEECEFLINEIESLEGALFEPTDVISHAVANIICFFTFGRRFEYSDGKFKELLSMLRRLMGIVGSAAAIHFFPMMKIFMRTKFRQLAKVKEEVFTLEREIIEEHKRTIDVDNPRDFVDAYLIESDKRRQKNENCSFTDEGYVLVTLADLFTAGTETTSTTLRWGLLYLCLNKHVQQTAQNEIDHVVGRHRQPDLGDQSNLPYTQALVYEIQRISSVFPLSVPHCAATETHLHGYRIPKGAEILPNLWSVLHDPVIWPEPEKLRPQRFLDEGMENVIRPERFIPFGIGPRVCLGEQIAKMELFLFLSNLLHRFRFELDEDIATDPNILKPVEGLTLTPRTYKLRANKRC
ncbi:cytochrome P450 2U1-like [Saccoglossus kowalevskii]|uniref:Cytochrome P450 2U1-like n=1 Tax=Saccoglossus kowalevskii TaxID=10224 RepID=A0ABM0LW07_SACKO|nr:PREDICTED: cytochrome P450 2U1-like [Saccoglossus kowalevskii]